ncbi:hypothetical protein HHI36_015301 [Cryptolaemus montrouzieri]|uniref:Cytochrome P450 n=1 Tax=Cryptolaemus montrouzieri TaxID=559131 RepID=A0ABD2N6E5_9CUCU
MLESPMFDNEVSSFFRKIIKETVEYRRTNHIERPDMLHLLMHAKKRTPKTNESINTEEGNAIDRNHFKFNEQQADTSVGLSLEDITSQAIFFFFAGYDTVATVLCFMSYELAINPHIQQKLIEELDEFRPKNNLLTNDSLSKLTYLDMVLSETLRKWSPNVIIDRQCVKQYEIQPEHPDEKSVNLTTDDVLWIPIWALHHDPKYWNKPDEFDPERFSPRNKNKIIPYTYLPFGIGARNCIGSRFVLMEVKTFFYGLLEHFTIVPIRKSTIPVKLKKETFFVDSKDGFWFGLKKRDTRNL